MRGLRVVVGVACAIALTIVAAQGCQDPTQVTLDISLTPRAQCIELPHGTAITVGVEPKDAEDRVTSGFVNAKTMECNPVSRHIGTLVVTPTDPQRASVIVVSGYREDPAKCKPPNYTGCIVARRRWSFAKSRPLRMPITIDPKCADVPCDAFSTCRDGLCFPSEVDTNACDGDGCIEPGSSADGGTNVDAAVVPEGGPLDGGPNVDAPLDSPSDTDGDDDAPSDAGIDVPDSGPPLPYCSTDMNILYCGAPGVGPVGCSGFGNCCDMNGQTAVCSGACPPSSVRYCCSSTDCGSGEHCPAQAPNAPTVARTCAPDDGGAPGAPPYCVPKPAPAVGENLICNAPGGGTMACLAPNECCNKVGPAACGVQGTCGGGKSKYCCSADDCGGAAMGWSCPKLNGQAGTCIFAGGGAPIYCLGDAGNGALHCGNDLSCNGPDKQCCEPNTCAMAGCGGPQRCCFTSDCPNNATCQQKGMMDDDGGFFPGTCVQ